MDVLLGEEGEWWVLDMEVRGGRRMGRQSRVATDPSSYSQPCGLGRAGQASPGGTCLCVRQLALFFVHFSLLLSV